MKIFCHEIFFCHKGEQYCFQKISRNIVFQKNQISKSSRSRVKDEQYCFQKFKFQTGQSEQYCFQKNSNFLAQQSEQYCLKKNLGHVQAEVKTNSIVFKKKFKYLAHQSEQYCFKNKQISKSPTSRVKNEQYCFLKNTKFQHVKANSIVIRKKKSNFQLTYNQSY